MLAILVVSHFFTFGLGLFLNRIIDRPNIKSSVRKLVSKRAEIIDPTNPIDNVEI